MEPGNATKSRGRAIVVRKLQPLPVEAVVRGYLIGSGWKDYRSTGQVCGIPLPPGLRMADRCRNRSSRPSTKAPPGDHDEKSPSSRPKSCSARNWRRSVREVSLAIYRRCAAYALPARHHHRRHQVRVRHRRGRTSWCLIDEILTPDSSRFWPADSYAPAPVRASFDKQYVRDYLETLDWDKRPPGPKLPPEVIARTAEKYREAQRRLIS